MKYLLAFLLLLPLTASAGHLGFSQMEEGDKIEVTYHSKGCFHDYTLYFEVNKSSGIFRITQYAIKWTSGPNPKIQEKRVLGSATLTQGDITGLDGLLKYYRGEKSGGSTTSEDVVVEYYEHGDLIQEEKLFDDSAGMATAGKDTVTFFNLALRLNGGAFR